MKTRWWLLLGISLVSLPFVIPIRTITAQTAPQFGPAEGRRGRTLRCPPPSGLDLLASHHGASGCQDRGLAETSRG